MTCKESIELMSEYLEGVLSPLWRDRFDCHTSACSECALYLSQMRMTILLAGRLRTRELDPEVYRRLLVSTNFPPAQ
jgi:anti-sigma factor RsiW